MQLIPAIDSLQLIPSLEFLFESYERNDLSFVKSKKQ